MSIKTIIDDGINNLTKLNSSEYIGLIEQSINVIIDCLRRGNKVLIAGNGGSASDAQHMAAELIGRFYMDRKALPAIALNDNISSITSIANDYSFENIFSRQIEGIGASGDVFIAISTSGNSTNVVKAVESARKNGITSIGLLGKNGGILKDMCDIAIIVPSEDTPRIQEMHILIIHTICQYVEIGLNKNE